MAEISSFNPSTDVASGSYLQPEQKVPESKMTPEWYLQNARWIASNYNHWIANLIPSGTPFGYDSEFMARWATSTIYWYSYYFGKQQMQRYAFVNNDEKNNPLPIPMFKDQSIPTIINFMLGNVKDVINVLPKIISAFGISDDIVSTKQLKMDLAKFKLDFAEIAQEQEILGVEVLKGMNFNSEEQIVKYFQESSKEMAEETYEILALDALYKNNWKDPFTHVSRDILVTGWGCFKIGIIAGKLTFQRISPWMSIWDWTSSSSQGRKARFGGHLEQISVPEVMARWGHQLTKREQDELEVIARNQQYQQPFNSLIPQTNLVWWRQGATGQPLITVAHTEWVGYKEMTEDNGKILYTTTRRRCTIIGNRYIVDYGECDNIVENKYNPSDTELSYRWCTPTSEFGYAQGIVEKLHTMSDAISLYRTKMMQLVARSKGKNHIIRAWKLPEAMRTPDIMADFSRMGLTVINDAGEEDDPNARMVEAVDMTMDPTVFGLIQVIQEMKVTMDDAMSIPQGVRGATGGYMPAKTQAFNKAQSTQGVKIYYDAIYDFFENCINYAADTYKVFITSEDSYEGSFLIGDKQVKWLKMEAKDLKFSTLGIFLEFEDISDEQDKKELKDVVMVDINRGALTSMDYVKITGMRSKRAMRNYLEGRYTYLEIKAAQKEEADRQAALAGAERQAQATENATQVASQAGLAKQEMVEQTKQDQIAANMMSQMQ